MNKYLRYWNKVFSVMNMMIYPFLFYWVILTAKATGMIPTYFIFMVAIMAYYFIAEAVKTLIQEGQIRAQEDLTWQMRQV